jgi:hypothetical protein
MLTARELSNGLYGAWRLAHLDRSAMQYFDASADGFLKSFYAAAICLPAFLIMMAIKLVHAELPEHIGFFEIAVVEASRYVIVWVAFPLLMSGISDVLQRGERYVGFVVAYNWAQVIETAVVLPIFLVVVAAGATPTEPNAIYTILYFAIGLYYWFIARTAFQISGWAAGAVVIANLILVEMIGATADYLLR